MANLGFSSRSRKSGVIEILHHGRMASTRRGCDATDFLTEVEADDEGDDRRQDRRDQDLPEHAVADHSRGPDGRQRGADHAARRLRRGRLAATCLHVVARQALPLAMSQRSLERTPHRFQVERFDDVLQRRGAHRLDRRFEIAVGGERERSRDRRRRPQRSR